MYNLDLKQKIFFNDKGVKGVGNKQTGEDERRREKG
jgi:hypothetical protein